MRKALTLTLSLLAAPLFGCGGSQDEGDTTPATNEAPPAQTHEPEQAAPEPTPDQSTMPAQPSNPNEPGQPGMPQNPTQQPNDPNNPNQPPGTTMPPATGPNANPGQSSMPPSPTPNPTTPNP